MPDPTPTIRFDDGAAYEAFMGRWSRLVGDSFLQWLAPPPRQRWLDVGCGNGAFTQLLVERCDPLAVQGIDPSPEQIAFARGRFVATASAQFEFDIGDADALPCVDAAADAAAMALVLFFVPDPARAVSEMARVVRPGGIVAAYTWDFHGGGFPYAALQEEMAALGTPPLLPPSIEASRLDTLATLWAGAGLVEIDTRTIRVQRRFDDFDSFWKIAQTGPPIVPRLATMTSEAITELEGRLRARLAAAPDGSITYGANANAIKGRRPG